MDETADDRLVRTVVFRREEGWYLIDLPKGDDLAKHAECNPGTLAVEDIYGNVLWQRPGTKSGTCETVSAHEKDR